MNPRASIPTTLSTLPRPKCTTIRSMIVENAIGSASTGVMSLKTMPGSGKSGTSRIRALISLDLHRLTSACAWPAVASCSSGAGFERRSDPRGGGLRGGVGRARRGHRARGGSVVAVRLRAVRRASICW